MITLRVNGTRYTLDVHPMKRLLDVLREECGLTGTKEGCGEGECGACTVLVDELVVNACLVPVAHADGTDVLTIEGVAAGGRLHPLQEAFVQHGGAQCGICTPGMIIASLSIGKGASPRRLQEALAGNLCRCTGYSAIYDAINAGSARKPRKRRAAFRPKAASATPRRDSRPSRRVAADASAVPQKARPRGR